MVKIESQSGFTLLEVLVTLTIAALVVTIALPYSGFGPSPATTEASALKVMSALEAERYASRRQAMIRLSEIDITRNQIRLTKSQTILEFPPGIRLGYRQAPPCDPTGRKIIFFPDGTSCAARIIISSSTATRVIEINSLTGAITLGE